MCDLPGRAQGFLTWGYQLGLLALLSQLWDACAPVPGT